MKIYIESNKLDLFVRFQIRFGGRNPIINLENLSLFVEELGCVLVDLDREVKFLSIFGRAIEMFVANGNKQKAIQILMIFNGRQIIFAQFKKILKTIFEIFFFFNFIFVKIRIIIHIIIGNVVTVIEAEKLL
jgi:hypothetical protein